MIKIIRQNKGRARTRFGILLRVLLPRHQKVLLNNPIIRGNSMDDRFIRCLFRIEDARVNISYLKRPFINPVSKEITTYAQAKTEFKFIDWNCAYCKKEIKSKVNLFQPENFTCEKCYTYYIKKNRKIDQCVLDSMLKFTEKYKALLKENQQKFIKYIKRNEKKNSLL